MTSLLRRLWGAFLMAHKTPNPLIERWKGEEHRISAIIADLKSGRDWTVQLGANQSTGWGELPLISTCPTLVSGAMPRDLRGIKFRDVDLSGCTGLADAYLKYATFDGVVMKGASLIGANLQHVTILGGAVFDSSNLSGSDWSNSVCENVSFVKADFTKAKISGALFDEVDLSDCRFRDVEYSVEGSLGFLRRKTWTRFGGRCRNIRNISPDSDHEFRRYLLGEVAARISRKIHPGLGFVWYILANFGRSPGRLLLWIILVWFSFGIVYAGISLPTPLNNGKAGDLLVWLAPKMKFADCGERPCNFFQPFYFSVVTLTTLGFGDVLPSAYDWKAQVFVFIESLFGFVFLGAYVSLLLQNSVIGRD